MSNLIGFVWKIARGGVDGEGKDYVDNDDEFLIGYEPDSALPNGRKYLVVPVKAGGKAGSTLKQCDNWCYEPGQLESQNFELLRGNIQLEESAEMRHIVMVCPDPSIDRKGKHTGYVFADTHKGLSANEILQEMDKPHPRNKVDAFTHKGTYHSGN